MKGSGGGEGRFSTGPRFETAGTLTQHTWCKCPDGPSPLLPNLGRKVQDTWEHSVCVIRHCAKKEASSWRPVEASLARSPQPLLQDPVLAAKGHPPCQQGRRYRRSRSDVGFTRFSPRTVNVVTWSSLPGSSSSLLALHPTPPVQLKAPCPTLTHREIYLNPLAEHLSSPCCFVLVKD